MTEARHVRHILRWTLFAAAVVFALLCLAATYYRAAGVYALISIAIWPWPWPFGLERFRSGRRS